MYTQENNFSPMSGSSPTTPTTVSSSSSSPWHPIHASPSEDMWELPHSTSSTLSSSSYNSEYLNERDYNSSGLQHLHSDENFYIHRHHDDDRNEMSTMRNTTTENNNYLVRGQEESSSRFNTTSNNNNSVSILSEKKCVLGDATNTTLRRNNNNANNNTTRGVRRSYFNQLAGSAQLVAKQRRSTSCLLYHLVWYDGFTFIWGISCYSLYTCIHYITRYTQLLLMIKLSFVTIVITKKVDIKYIILNRIYYIHIDT